MTSVDSQVVLTRDRGGLLTGIFELKRGRRYPIRMTKASPTQASTNESAALESEAREAEAAGKWSRASTLYRQASSRERVRGQYQRAIEYRNKSLEASGKGSGTTLKKYELSAHWYRLTGG